MIFKRFSFLLIFRIFLIGANMLIISSIFGDDRLFFNQLILGFLLILQLMEIIRFVNTTNREITKFFDAIRQSDFTINMSKDYLGKSYKGLFESMQMLLNTYKQVKIEKEAQLHLLQQIISHVPAGIIVVREDKDIILINDAAKILLNIPEYKTWNNVSVKAQSFAKAIENLPSAGRFLTEIDVANQKRYLSLDLSQFTMLDQEYKLITFTDIRSEIEQNEIDAWHKLIRILTHEIMNSVTPISSLSETMQQMLEEKGTAKKKISSQTIEDVLFSTKTIQKRSVGLLAFVEDYRKLTKVPKPILQNVNFLEMVQEISDLMGSEISKQDIQFKTDIPEDLSFSIDRNLISQILINLVKNSIEALSGSEQPQITIEAKDESTYCTILIVDNGEGINEKDAPDVWVPFYTTKPNGSGIGLSLSRQIMKMHQGSISFISDPGVNTTFTLTFRKRTS